MPLATARWNDDWNRLTASPHAQRALQRWRCRPGLDHPDLGALLVAAGAGALTPEDHADRVLGELVALAAHDGVAGRVVLQRVLPGLLNVARRRVENDVKLIEPALEDVAATAWTVIVTYPLERRPARYASNIVRDAEYQCFVRPRRLRRVDEQLIGLHGVDERTGLARLDGRSETAHGNASELVDALLERGQRRGLADDDVTLLRLLYVDGCGIESVAAERSISGRAVRYRREAAVARLARLTRRAA